jgi:riboflavin biosynthesis pyrimidine reductase
LEIQARCNSEAQKGEARLNILFTYNNGMNFFLSMRKIAEFSSPNIPIEEIEDYYGIYNIKLLPNRPYCWSNSVTSIDGVLHFLEESANVGEIGLNHIPQARKYQKADWRLLQASWAHSDGVLITGQILRDEENADCTLAFQDLIDYRIKVLKKNAQPIQIILSKSGDFPLNRPLFNQNVAIWILTSLEGKSKLENLVETLMADVKIFVVDKELSLVMKFLKSKGIDYLDISCGGRVIRSLIDLEILDEIRLTQVGQIIGKFNTIGEERPNLHPSAQTKNYTPDNAPLVKWLGIRVIGDHFVFHRGVFEYRGPSRTSEQHFDK